MHRHQVDIIINRRVTTPNGRFRNAEMIRDASYFMLELSDLSKHNAEHPYIAKCVYSEYARTEHKRLNLLEHDNHSCVLCESRSRARWRPSFFPETTPGYCSGIILRTIIGVSGASLADVSHADLQRRERTHYSYTTLESHALAFIRPKTYAMSKARNRCTWIAYCIL